MADWQRAVALDASALAAASEDDIRRGSWPPAARRCSGGCEPIGRRCQPVCRRLARGVAPARSVRSMIASAALPGPSTAA